MLMPKKTKYRKVQRGRTDGKAYRGSDISFGEVALKAVEPSKLTARQIEAARISIMRKIKEAGNSGFVYSLTVLSQRNRRKPVRVKERVILNISKRLFSPVKFFLNSAALRNLSHSRRFVRLLSSSDEDQSNNFE